MDADCAFVQAPEILFYDSSYNSTGALLFYDRLVNNMHFVTVMTGEGHKFKRPALLSTRHSSEQSPMNVI